MSKLVNKDKSFVKSILSQSKIKLFVFIFCFFSSILFIIAINYTIDPYQIFVHKPRNILYDSKVIDDRKVIYPKMKLYANKNYDMAITGSSSVDTIVTQQKLEKNFPNNSIYKFTMISINPSEQYELIKNFIKLNPEVKKIYIAVDFDEMTLTIPNMLPKYSGDKLNSREVAFILLSAETTKRSLTSIYLTARYIIFPDTMFLLKKSPFFSKFKIFGKYRHKIVQDYNRYPRLRYTDWNIRKINKDSYKYLKKIKELCDKNNKQVVFWTCPLHSNALYDIYYQGVYNELEVFKRELVKIAPFYDFLYVCEYTNQPISPQCPYFTNAMHGDKALGDLIMKKIVLNEGKYGVYITENNIEDVIKKNKLDLLAYAEKNKNYLKEYVSYKDSDLTTEEIIIYIE